jgi:hypothetical protein
LYTGSLFSNPSHSKKKFWAAAVEKRRQIAMMTLFREKNLWLIQLYNEVSSVYLKIFMFSDFDEQKTTRKRIFLSVSSVTLSPGNFDTCV